MPNQSGSRQITWALPISDWILIISLRDQEGPGHKGANCIYSPVLRFSVIFVRGHLGSSSSFFTTDGFEKRLNSLDSGCPSTQAASTAQIAVGTLPQAALSAGGSPRCHPAVPCNFLFVHVGGTSGVEGKPGPALWGARSGKQAHLGGLLLRGRGDAGSARAVPTDRRAGRGLFW